MSRYLDPKNDLVFKRIFGQNPELLKDLLNSLLPLETPIKSLEYLPAELVPDIPLMKNTIVDVRCKDENDRQFIVEIALFAIRENLEKEIKNIEQMQMLWTDSFKNRVIFNASKAYVRQLEKGEFYNLLEPVYALSLVNEDFMPNSKEFIHNYKIINKENSEDIIDGLSFSFIELKKFKAKSFKEKKVQFLWLRFLSEIDDKTQEIPKDLSSNKLIFKAINLTKESAYSSEELLSYDKYWDVIQVEKTIRADSWNKGKIEGKIEEKYLVIDNGIEIGMSLENLSKLTVLSVEEIQKYLESKKN